MGAAAAPSRFLAVCSRPHPPCSKHTRGVYIPRWLHCHTRQLVLTGGHRVQVRRKSSVTKRSHSPAVRAPPGKLSADFIQRHAANVSEKIKAGNRSLLPRARGPRATSLEKENLKNMKVGAVLPSRASPSADLSADSAGTDDTAAPAPTPTAHPTNTDRA